MWPIDKIQFFLQANYEFCVFFFFAWLIEKFHYFHLKRLANFIVSFCNRLVKFRIVSSHWKKFSSDQLTNFVIISNSQLRNFTIFSHNRLMNFWIFPATIWWNLLHFLVTDRQMFRIFSCKRSSNFSPLFHLADWQNSLFVSYDRCTYFESFHKPLKKGKNQKIMSKRGSKRHRVAVLHCFI